MTRTRRISKEKPLITNKREIKTKTTVNNSTGDVTTKGISSKVTVRPLLTTKRTLYTKIQLKLKRKLFPPYWTNDKHVTKWWQRKTLKWWKKEKWFTKLTTKTTKPTRKVPTNPKNEMGKYNY